MLNTDTIHQITPGLLLAANSGKIVRANFSCSTLAGQKLDIRS